MSERARKIRIFKQLNRLGVPTSIVGREYIETGVLLMMQDKTLLYKITKRLYPAIAKQHGVTAHIVSHAIDNAIAVSWGRADLDELELFFGGTVSGRKGKPTNSEYLSMVARWLLLEEEEDTE